MSILDHEILNLDGNSWTVRDSCTGLICFGMTGSGKSSGPLRSIALRFLELKFGGIVFCAKPDECETWEGYASETGRSDDLIRLSENTFAFLNYEMERPAGTGGGQIENVVDIFLEVTKIGKDKRAATNDEYWQNAIKQFLRNTISLLVMAHEAVTLPNIKMTIDTALRGNDVAEAMKGYCSDFKAFCSSKRYAEFIAGQNEDGYNEAVRQFDLEYTESQGKALNNKVLAATRQYANMLILKAIYFGKGTGPDYELALNYFLTEFPQLDERTRSNTISSFTVLADSMLRGEFLRCFGAPQSSFSLESLYREGKILIVDQDVKRYGLVGQITAAIIKLCFERMIERREDITQDDALPVFLWADEAQYFSLDNDQMFQTTARSSRTLTVYATQNISNLQEGYGKEKSSSLLGNLGTKIFCKNGDYETNKWAADSIGQEIIRRRSQNIGDSKSGGMKGDYSRSDSYSEGWSEQKDYMVDIVTYTTLQAGGPRGHCKVGYVFWQSGRILNNGKVFLIGTFEQKCRKICGTRFVRHCPPIPQIGGKNAGHSSWLHRNDYMIGVIFMITLAATGVGIWLIFSERDIFLWFIPEVGIITLGTIFLWMFAFSMDAGLEVARIGVEIIGALIKKTIRKKQKRINRVPLITCTWVYLFFSFAITVLIQNTIYTGKSATGYILTWGGAAVAHFLFKGAGGRRIPIE